ncbi:TPA: hypothetical protein JBK40_10530 [Legionella pneumophila]|nr:hypothetical protein [Legionella pneumophila]HAT2048772.1 hypothetical protein [Legionella pneumophila]HAT4008560.1 hypothetical protein [Legionella pneumophila]HAT6363453.1 hypothetical protein [Legionella pneumophila]HAT6367072.1 hypothetical protein [Legionella pneumophila]HAT6370373.1 hypothetical protein [Legionella pneumophila]
MLQPFITDFIKNRSLQFIFAMGLISDITAARTIKHIVVLFGFPYLSSVVLYCLMNRKKATVKARISEQYRPKQKKISR